MKVLLTAARDEMHAAIWDEARADPRSAYLPWSMREIIEGRLDSVVVEPEEWARLQSFLASLPSGKQTLPISIADAPPPEPVEVGDRAVVAGKIAEIVKACGATSPYGGDVMRELAGKYYAVPFSCAPTVHGCVFVYSPDYIRVAFVARTPEPPPHGLPVQDSRLYDSPELVAKFLALVLHGGKYQAALELPQRQPKRKKNP